MPPQNTFGRNDVKKEGSSIYLIPLLKQLLEGPCLEPLFVVARYRACVTGTSSIGVFGLILMTDKTDRQDRQDRQTNLTVFNLRHLD